MPERPFAAVASSSQETIRTGMRFIGPLAPLGSIVTYIRPLALRIIFFDLRAPMLEGLYVASNLRAARIDPVLARLGPLMAQVADTGRTSATLPTHV